MTRLLVFGLGYSAGAIARRVTAAGGSVVGTSRDGRDGTLRFDDPQLAAEIAAATHVLSSIPPAEARDPVLDRYGDQLPGRWLGYLSSTGVYGDASGAWVDETAPVGSDRRGARVKADARWQALGARVFRLPGIYGPGRSPLDRLRAGTAHRVDVADQVFSRIHVDDLASGVVLGFDAPPGVYNLADDEPASQNAVIEHAAMLLGVPPPPRIDLASLSPIARSFFAENRRVANGKATRVLGWRPRYPTYRVGLRALNAMSSPAAVSTDPIPASGVQR